MAIKLSISNGIKKGFPVPVKNVPALINAMELMGKISLHIAVEKYDVHKVNALILKRMRLT